MIKKILICNKFVVPIKNKSEGHKDLIVKIKKKIPDVSADGKRLQLIVCSATLHNIEVKKLADQLMHFPMWVDLKGQDTVPDTIHHCVCIIDPKEDQSWRTMKNKPITDAVHATDRLENQTESKGYKFKRILLLECKIISQKFFFRILFRSC